MFVCGAPFTTRDEIGVLSFKNGIDLGCIIAGVAILLAGSPFRKGSHRARLSRLTADFLSWLGVAIVLAGSFDFLARAWFAQGSI